jgi:hypothetical protein
VRLYRGGNITKKGKTRPTRPGLEGEPYESELNSLICFSFLKKVNSNLRESRKEQSRNSLPPAWKGSFFLEIALHSVNVFRFSLNSQPPSNLNSELPNYLEPWDETMGKWWAPQGEDMLQKSRPLTPYNSRNHGSHRGTPRARVRKAQIHGDSRRLSKIIHKEAKCTHPWPPSKKS